MPRLLFAAGGLFPAFLFLLAAGGLWAIAYMDVLASVVVWLICGTLIVHVGHELISGLGRQIQKRYRDDPYHDPSSFDRYGPSWILIAAGFFCGFVPFLLPWVVGFAAVDFPATHWWLFRYREDSKYNYKPKGSSPAHKTALVLFGVGLVGTWVLSKGEISTWTVGLWAAGALTSPLAHGFGFFRARFGEVIRGLFAEDVHR